MAQNQNDHLTAKPYPAEKARQGEIILKTPLQRAVFIAGLAAIVVVAILSLFAH